MGVTSPLKILVALLAVALPLAAAQDACLLGPWPAAPVKQQFGATILEVSSFDDLQTFVDGADGPTVLLVRAASKVGLNASRTLVVSKPDIVISTLAAFEPSGAANHAELLPVSCGAAKTLVSIRAEGVQLRGFSITGCTAGAIAVEVPADRRPVVLSDLDISGNTAVRGGALLVVNGSTVVRRCLMQGNTATEVGGAVYAEGASVWISESRLKDNFAVAGGAAAAQDSRLLLSGSRINFNKATLEGGALFVQRAPLPSAASPGGCWGEPAETVRILDTRIGGNQAGNGGAIAISDGASLVAHHTDLLVNDAKDAGGAILAGDGAALNLKNVVFDGNTAGKGAGLHLDHAGNVLLDGCAGFNNSASVSGGVLYVNGTGSELTLRDSAFDFNYAKLLGGVAAIRDENKVVIERSNFTRNEAEVAAGVIYGMKADLDVSDSLFSANWAGQDGGALYCAGGCEWDVKRSVFFNNTCAHSGAALFGWNMRANVSASVFDTNAAAVLGGAISMANSSVALEGTRLIGNQAAGNGSAGGAVYSQGSEWLISRSDVEQNLAEWGGALYFANSSVTVAHTGVFNNSALRAGAGAHALNTKIVFDTTEMHDNLAREHAGSLYCQASDCTVKGSDYFNETSEGGAGSIYAVSSNLTLLSTNISGALAAGAAGGGALIANETLLRVTGVRVSSSSAPLGAGGALLLAGARDALIEGSAFEGNAAAQGGAIALDGSSLTLQRSSVRANRAEVDGGVAALRGSKLVVDSTALDGNSAEAVSSAAEHNSTITIVAPAASAAADAAADAASLPGAPTAVAGAANGSDAATVGILSTTAEAGALPKVSGMGGGWILPSSAESHEQAVAPKDHATAAP